MDSANTFQIDPAGLAVPVVLAFLAALVAVRLADRARSQKEGRWLRVWLMCSGLALGAGVWGTHFAAAMAVRGANTRLGFDFHLVLASLGVGVAFSAAAFHVAHRFRGRVAATLTGSVLAAGGALATHYLGLLALETAPALHWDTSGLAGSGAVMLALCVGAFLLFFHAGSFEKLAESQRQLVASALMAAGLIGMMLVSLSGVFTLRGAAAQLPDLPATDELLWAITIGSLSVVLTLLLVASLVDADLEARVRTLTEALRTARSKLAYAASHDLLTRLITRPAFEGHLERALKGADLYRRQVAVLFVDLDDFKTLNGAWGPAAGDQVLQQVGTRLKETARNGDVVARIGWDQFVVLMEKVESPQAMSTAAHRMVSAIARPMGTPHGSARLTCSVGIATCTANTSPTQLLSNAHSAMLDARGAGGNTFRFFDSGMDPASPEMVTLQQELRQALERGELDLHYQPIVRADNLRPCAIEALIRWHHPVRGMLAPGFFLPAAERFDLTVAIGQWVLEEAASQVASWAQMGLRLRVSVNVFPSQIRMPGLAEQLAEAHRRFKIPPGLLALDVAEPVLLSETQAAERLFAALREIGMPGSIDDFGHSCSLQQLRMLRPREVKVDRALVSKLESSADALAIVDAVIRLAHALDIRVVAKGVETRRQQEILMALECDELQGMRFAGPMPAADLTDYLLHQMSEEAGLGPQNLDAMSDFAAQIP